MLNCYCICVCVCVCVLLTCIQHDGEEDVYIDVESDDVDSLLSVFDEITAELLEEGSLCLSTELQSEVP